MLQESKDSDSSSNDDQEEDFYTPRGREERIGAHDKMEFVGFSVKRDIEAFLDWIKNTENFDCKNTLDHKKVKLVVLKLKGGSLA